ncbi:MAG: hypothetical protein LWW81_03370 [Rhodocyclales bacterium]|nr:hypothetical protein [Rhodocyclales bacterium]
MIGEQCVKRFAGPTDKPLTDTVFVRARRFAYGQETTSCAWRWWDDFGSGQAQSRAEGTDIHQGR